MMSAPSPWGFGKHPKITDNGAMKKGNFPSEQKDRLLLRFPDGMREELAQFAKRNERSLNSEIIARLENSLEPERKAYGLGGSDPYRVILDANVRISQLLREIEGAMQALGKEAGKLKVSEEKPTYSAVVEMLPTADREIITLASSLSDDARESLINLIKQTTGRSGK